MHSSALILILCFVYLVRGDFEFVSPKSGHSYSASGSDLNLEIKWKDDNGYFDQYNLKNADSYTLALCTGSNDDFNCFSNNQLLVSDLKGSARSYTAKIDSSDYPDGIYFLQANTQFKTGYTMQYSNRFKLSGMDGSTKTLSWDVTASMDEAPEAQTSGNTEFASLPTESYYVPYTKQTNVLRHAPMQSFPGSKITHSKWSRRHPTSHYTAFSTKAGRPDFFSTSTLPWSYSVTSEMNDASQAPYPSYYYPASSRITKKASLSSASKTKRWA